MVVFVMLIEQDLFERPNFEFVRHDITEPFRAEVDQIYNMACPASPVHYQYNPIKTTKVRRQCKGKNSCSATAVIAGARQQHFYYYNNAMGMYHVYVHAGII